MKTHFDFFAAKFLLLAGVIFLCANNSFGQNLYSETFEDVTDGATSDVGTSGWNVDTSPGFPDTFSKQSTISGLNFFQGTDTDGDVKWYSDLIDISGFAGGVTVSYDIAETGRLEVNDYIGIYYNTNGLQGADNVINETFNDFGNALTTITSGTITGTNIQIVIIINNNGNSESHYFTNVRVTSAVGGSTLYSTGNGDWSDGSNWSTVALGGASCSCFPDETTPIFVGNNNTIDISLNASTNDITIENTGTLQFTADNLNLNVQGDGEVIINSGGTLTDNAQTGCDLDFEGDGSSHSLVVNSGSTVSFSTLQINGTNPISISGDGTLTVENDFDLNEANTVTVTTTGTFSIGNDLDVGDAVTLNLNGSSTFSIGNDIDFNSAGGTINNNQTVTVAQDIEVDAPGTNAISGSGTIRLGNNFNFNTDNSVINNSNIIDVSLDLNFGPGDINNTLTNSGTITIGGNMNFDDDGNGVTNTGTINITGNLSFDNDNCTVTNNNSMTIGMFEVVASTDDGNSLVNGSGASLTINGAVDMSNGTTTINNSGTITQSGDFIAIPTSSAINNLNGATWNWSGANFDDDLTTVLSCITNSNTFNYTGGNQELIDIIYHNVTINGAGTKALLDGPVTINNLLTLTDGLISLSTNNLTIGPSGSISGGSSNSFVVTDHTGELIQQGVGSGGRTGDVLFPVGKNSSEYTPLTVNNSGTADNFNIHICNGVYLEGGCEIGTPVTSDIIDKTWFVSEGTAGGSNVTLTFQWDISNELTGFDQAGAFIAHHNGTIWENIGAVTIGDANPTFTASLAGITSFSPFGVSSNLTVLPIELTSFTAEWINDKVLLQWETASETNNDFFTVEKTFDFQSFQEVAMVNGNGTTTEPIKYSFVDRAPYFGTSYYRLKQTDFNRAFTYSEPVRIVNNAKDLFTRVHPNPSAGQQINIDLQGLNESEEVSFSVIDLQGKVLHNQILKADKFGGLNYSGLFDQKLSPGIYNLILESPSHPTVIKKLAVK